MYKRILSVVGTLPTSEPAVRESVALARVHGSEVVFVYVLPRYVMPVTEFAVLGEAAPAEFQRDARANAERDLSAAAAMADQAGVRSRKAMVSGPDDVECVIDVARKRRCSLIVVASAGRNAVMRLLAGSVIPGLITHATIPVLVVRRPSRPSPQRTQRASGPRQRSPMSDDAQGGAA